MYEYNERIQRIKECYEISEEAVGLQISESCVPNSVRVAELLNDLSVEVQSINPSSFDAIMFEFVLSGKYVMIECYEDGSICILERHSNGRESDIEIYKFEDLKQKLLEVFGIEH